MKSLFTALADAQAEFMAIRKSSRAHNYKYAPLDVVREAITPTLTKYGLVVIQFPISEDDKVGVRTILGHESGECIEQVFCARLLKSDPQAIGSAITYFRRYALLACLGLAPEDEDDDANHAMPEKEVRPKQQRNESLASENPGEFTFDFGKFKGKKIKELEPGVLYSYGEYLERSDPTGKALVVLENIKKYLENM